MKKVVSPVEFVLLLLFRLGFLAAVLSSCSCAAPVPSTDPWQRHIIGTGNTSEMVVSFVTQQPCSSAVVRVSSHPALPTFPAASTPFDLAVPWTCTKLNYTNSTENSSRVIFFHDAKLTGLAADTEYHYVVGSRETGCGWSPPAHFTTAEPRVFAILADFGHQRAAPRTHAALRAMAQDGRLDAVLHAGDFAYDFEGEYSTGPFNGRAGDRFMEQIGSCESRRFDCFPL